MTILAKIDVTKIEKARLFRGAKGTYLDLVIIEKKSDYGDFMICQSVTKEEREKGIKGPILGNGKYARRSAPSAAENLTSTPDNSGAANNGVDEDVPY